VAEAVDGGLIASDLGPDQLERDSGVDFLTDDFVDATHAAAAQFLDDLVAAGEGRARLERVWRVGRRARGGVAGFVSGLEVGSAPGAKRLRVRGRNPARGALHHVHSFGNVGVRPL